jgi:hypothetical protein
MKRLYFIILLILLQCQYLYSQKIEWYNLFLNNNNESSIRQTYIDENNNLYISGGLRGEINFNIKGGVETKIPKNDNLQHFIAKWNGKRELQWANLISPNYYTQDASMQSNNLVKDINNNIYLKGATGVNVEFYNKDTLINTYGDIYICKHNTKGERIWQKTYGKNFVSYLKIVTNNSNNLVFSGNIKDSYSYKTIEDRQNEHLFARYQDFSFVTSMDTNGNFIWIKPFHSPASVIFDFTLDTSNNIYTIGLFKDTLYPNPNDTKYYITSDISGNFNTFIIKLNEKGEYQWCKKLDASFEGKIEFDKENGLIISSCFNGSFDIDPSSSNEVRLNSKEKNRFDEFIAKFDLEGNYLWHKQLYKTRRYDYYNTRNQLSIDSFIILAGNFDEEIRLKENSPFIFKSDGISIPYIAMFDKNGDIISSIILKTKGKRSGTQHVFQNKDGIFWGGYVTGDTDFDPTMKENVKKVFNHPAGFIIKLSFNSYNENEIDNGITSNSNIKEKNKIHFSFYPNPFKNSIKFAMECKNMKITLFNSLGQIVYCEENQKNKEIDLGFLPKGFYYIQTENENFKQVSKIEKE